MISEQIKFLLQGIPSFSGIPFLGRQTLEGRRELHGWPAKPAVFSRADQRRCGEPSSPE